MVECTLQEAIERCMEDGGIARPKDSDGWYDKRDFKSCEFGADLITAPWIYEPPKQSAFQKVRSANPAAPKGSTGEHILKQGWNAAIDEVLKLPLTDQLEHLKSKH